MCPVMKDFNKTLIFVHICIQGVSTTPVFISEDHCKSRRCHAQIQIYDSLTVTTQLLNMCIVQRMILELFAT